MTGVRPASNWNGAIYASVLLLIEVQTARGARVIAVYSVTNYMTLIFKTDGADIAERHRNYDQTNTEEVGAWCWTRPVALMVRMPSTLQIQYDVDDELMTCIGLISDCTSYYRNMWSYYYYIVKKRPRIILPEACFYVGFSSTKDYCIDDDAHVKWSTDHVLFIAREEYMHFNAWDFIKSIAWCIGVANSTVFQSSIPKFFDRQR